MPLRVLVVDDEPDLRELLCEEVALLGFEPVPAKSGNEALDKLSKDSFDAVICDLRMPNGDGLFLLKELKEKHLSELPVILMSGFSDLTPEAARGLGAIALMSKPYDRTELIKNLKGIASRIEISNK